MVSWVWRIEVMGGGGELECPEGNEADPERELQDGEGIEPLNDGGCQQKSDDEAAEDEQEGNGVKLHAGRETEPMLCG